MSTRSIAVTMTHVPEHIVQVAGDEAWMWSYWAAESPNGTIATGATEREAVQRLAIELGVPRTSLHIVPATPTSLDLIAARASTPEVGG